MGKTAVEIKKDGDETIEKTLIIAEKPSVARDIVKTLPGNFSSQKTHFESDKYIVSFAIGHLVTICTPPEIDEKHKVWSFDNLPILPESFPLKSLSDSRTQLNALTRLIKRRDVHEIINACDAGREGELIFRYIIQYIENGKPIKKTLKRLWLQSMTKEAILEGLSHLRQDKEMKNLESAAISRSEADWLIGINGSRALTSYKSRFGGFRLTPCGRVQTPTLAMIISRENEIQQFKSKNYWEVHGTFNSDTGDYEGKWFDPEFKKDTREPHGRPERIWKKSFAQGIIDKCSGKSAEITDTSKPVTQNSPPLYDLTTLQREANNRFGFSAKMTLDIVQSLYERHKMVTYPRTDSRHLPENYINDTKKVIVNLHSTDYGVHAKKITEKKWVTPSKKIFNNARITDHHAIIPTGNKEAKLSEVETKIYKMITQRFLAVFFPPMKILHTIRISIVEDESFKTEGKIIQDPGWKAVYGVDAKEDSLLPPLSKSSKAHLKNVALQAEVTKAPPRHTESSLLSVMESAGKLIEDEDLRDAMKERGLGTAATRATIIEGLIKDKYIVRNGKELIPSAKAFELIETINAMKIDELASPELTGEWEFRLEQISQGSLKRDIFMKEIKKLTSNIVKKVKSFDEDSDFKKKEVFEIPETGQKVFESLSFYENEDKTLRIRRYLGGKYMSKSEVQELIEKKKLGPLAGFISKDGKPFSAMIKLNDQNKVEFVFQDISENPPDFSSMKLLGVSPLDGEEVFEGEMSYVSKSVFKKNCKTGLRINKIILGKELTPEDIIMMLDGKKTRLIQGFRSSRTKKLFDAYLSLPKSGKIKFMFPPKKQKKSEK